MNDGFDIAPNDGLPAASTYHLPGLSAVDESKAQVVFCELLRELPESLKYTLLIQALEACGPDCLVGLEDARDAILYAAARLEPALLRNVTSFLEQNEDDGGDDADMAEHTAVGAAPFGDDDDEEGDESGFADEGVLFDEDADDGADDGDGMPDYADSEEEEEREGAEDSITAAAALPSQAAPDEPAM